MKKFLTASLLGLVLVVTTAAPALAIRDPFDPVISQAQLTGAGAGTGAAGTGGAGTAGTGTGETGATLIGQNGSEALANTGADTEPWLVAAFALIAFGAAAIVLAKANSSPIA
ncbi:MAG: hypothetical protein M3N53_13890 [Actinomycetota bacterium]|nr:hypothetical protein [Actinomycetota bacterium]